MRLKKAIPFGSNIRETIRDMRIITGKESDVCTGARNRVDRNRRDGDGESGLEAVKGGETYMAVVTAGSCIIAIGGMLFSKVFKRR